MSVPVDFQLNADTAGFTQSMGQAIGVSQNYMQVATGVRGATADMSGAFVQATQRLTGFTKINSIAADAAAAQQKALANIEATATVTGKSFANLSSATRSLARDFPIGMQGAVDVMESIQSVGVKSEQQFKSLGKSFVQLGAATNTNAASIGRDMTLLGKSMGNGVSQFEALSDSLTTVTKKLGASAPATIAFSKALAPIAATVGIGQTSVMGLSAAMSSLGEDGVRSANVFNKVLLDMNRSIRDGGPELKAYADIMGTTSDKLRDMFKSNPTEVLNQFTESLSKAGQGSQRLLENLGFDSVRDTRSLQALARTPGGVRGAIDTSVGAYGSGSTKEAAGAAMGGVLDQASMLKETMGQTISNIGKPLMGVMGLQLKIATKVAGLMEGATGSDAYQKAGTVGAIGGAAWGGISTAMQGLMVAAMVKGGVNALRNSQQLKNFRQGAALASYGVGAEEGVPATRAERAGMGMQSAMMAGGMGSGRDALSTSGKVFSRGVRMAGDATNRFARGYYGNVLRMGLDEPQWHTPSGEAYIEARKAFKANEIPREDLNAARKAYMAGLVNPPGWKDTGKNLLETGKAITTDAGRFAGGTALKAAGKIGAGLSAIGGPMLAVGAGIAAGTWAYGQADQGQTNLQGMRDTSGDIYASMNSFAEATGKAGHGLVSFQQVVQETTSKMIAGNNSMDKALTVSGAEASASQNAGYKRAFTSMEGLSDPKSIAAQLTATLGPQAAPEDVARALMDVSNQWGSAAGREVAKEVTPYYVDAKKNTQDISTMVQDIGGKKSIGSIVGANADQTQLGTLLQNSAQQRATEVGLAYGGTKESGGLTISAQQIESVKQAQKIYEAMSADAKARNNGLLTGEMQTKSGVLSNILGVTEEQQKTSGLRQDWNVNAGDTAWMNGTSWQDFMKTLAKSGNDAARVYLEAQKQGMTSDYSWAAGDTEAVKQSKELAKSWEHGIGVSDSFSSSLYTASDAASKAGTELKSLPGDIRAGMRGVPRALADLAKQDTPKTEYAAGSAILDKVLASVQGNTTKANALLQGNLANAPSNMPELTTGLQAAITQLQTGAGAMQSAILGPRGMANQQIAAGFQAQSQQANISPQMSASNSMSISMGQSAQAQMAGDAKGVLLAYGQMNAGIMQASRSAGIQMGAIARDGALKVLWAEEDHRKQDKRARQDYNIQLKEMEFQHHRQEQRMTMEFNRSERYAAEDFARSKFTARRDYDTQMARAERDFNISVRRANRDNDLGIARAHRDFNISQARAQEDYDRQKARANEDFNKSMFRATRDFGIQQAQAAEDYNKARLRAQQDYDKQIKRMVEDSAKQMYDPYKRIAAQMVMDAGQLVTNLKDQTKAIQGQVDNLAKVRAMGLSEEAIKALNLADSSNAQQLARLVGDMQGNGAFAGQLNQQVTAKNTAATGLVTDQGNTAYARAAEDYATAQTRMAEDFTTATTRANEAFARQMADAQVDFSTSTARMEQDFNISVQRSTDDFNKSMADNAVNFANSMADMKESFQNGVDDARRNFDVAMSDMDFQYAQARIRAQEGFQQQLLFADQDLNHSISVMEKALKLSLARSDEDLATSVKRMKIQTANAISDVGAQLGASIAAMKESFNGLLETAGNSELQLAQRTEAMFAALGGPQGEAQKQLDRWAKMIIQQDELTKKLSKGGISPQDPVFYSQGYLPPQRMPDAQSEPGSYTDSYAQAAQAKPLPPMEIPGDPVSAFVEMGKNMWNGLVKGFTEAASDNLFVKSFEGLVGAVKGMLGIQSPSTVFAEIGRNIMEGLGQGIAAAAQAAWDFVTAPIKDLDIIGKVTGAWAATGKFLGDLGTTIAGLVSTGWSNLTAPIANLDIMGKITTAFGEAVTFMSGLGGKITTWISTAWTNIMDGMPTAGEVWTSVTGAFTTAKQWLQDLVKGGVDSVSGWVSTAWDNLTANLPSLDDIKTAVVDIFTGKNGLSSWLKSLPNTIKDDWLPDASFFTTAFSAIEDGIKNVLGAMIDAWNKIEWKIDFTLPEINIPGFNIAKFSIPLGLGKTLDFAGFGWDGTKIGGQHFSTGDIVPNIPNPWAKKALGGISMRQETATIAEAGYPEAVIPLNERGASYMASVMARYANAYDVKASQSNQYSTPITYNNVSYDQRTQYTGPITVQAQDPDEMNAKLEAKRRRQNLVSTVGAR